MTLHSMTGVMRYDSVITATVYPTAVMVEMKRAVSLMVSDVGGE